MSHIVPLLSIVHSQAMEPQPQDKVYCDQDILSPKTLALENQQLHADLASLSQRFEYQANVNFELESQIKGMQAENEILLDALEEDHESLPLLTTPTEPGSMNGYWEQEYRLLKEKIRHVEKNAIDKDCEIEAAQLQNEKLLNELLCKCKQSL